MANETTLQPHSDRNQTLVLIEYLCYNDSYLTFRPNTSRLERIMRKIRRSSSDFLIIAIVDPDQNERLHEYAWLAEALSSQRRQLIMLLIAVAAIVYLWPLSSTPDAPKRIFSPYPQVSHVQGSRAITGNAIPDTLTATPNPIVAMATQDKVVSGFQANEQFRASSENPRDLALCAEPDGEPTVQLPDGAIVTVVGLASRDNRWTYVRSRQGDEGWIQLTVLQRLTSDAP
jgi:hypothetical protein